MGVAIARLPDLCDVGYECARALGAFKRTKWGLSETRDGPGDGDYSTVRATFLVVFLLAGFLPLLHTTARTLLLNYRKLSALRNVAGRLARRDARNQLSDLFASVVDWTHRVDVATLRISMAWKTRLQ